MIKLQGIQQSKEGEGNPPFSCSICGETDCLPIPPSIFHNRKASKLYHKQIQKMKQHCVKAGHSLPWFIVKEAFLTGSYDLSLQCYTQYVFNAADMEMGIAFDPT
jgi:hypothetical protein